MNWKYFIVDVKNTNDWDRVWPKLIEYYSVSHLNYYQIRELPFIDNFNFSSSHLQNHRKNEGRAIWRYSVSDATFSETALASRQYYSNDVRLINLT